MFTTPTTIGKGENNDFCIGQRSQISLLALSVGQRLCIDFFDSRANFLTTLRSHLDVTCFCYFYPIYWFNM